MVGLVALFAAVVPGCSHVSEQNLLSFAVSEVNDKGQERSVIPERVSDALNLIGFVARDNELIVTTDFMSEYCLDVIDMTSGETVRRLCRKGRGPGEFLSVSPLFSITGDALTIYDFGTGAASEVLTSGEDAGYTVRQVKLEAGKTHPNIMSSYKVSEDDIIAYNSIQGSAEFVSIDSPYYAVYDWRDGKEKRAFKLFDAIPLEKETEFVRMNAFALADCINSQRTTLCFAMNSMPVYGFLDIRTGKVKGFRIKGATPFSATDPYMFFTGICAQDDYVYALYFGRPTREHMPGANTLLYKMDWNGRILNKYKLDGLFRSCCATPDALYLSKVEDNQTLRLYRLETCRL